MAKVKTLPIGTILTKDEMNQAITIYNSLSGAEKHKFAERCAAEIIRPIIARINKLSDQENDPLYLAYCIEYALHKTKRGHHA